MCIRIYIFNFKDNNIKKTKNKNKLKKKIKTKTKENKEEKVISVANTTEYNDNISEFVQCSFNLFDRLVDFSWLLYKFNKFMCNDRNILLAILEQHMKYTLSRTKIKESY